MSLNQILSLKKGEGKFLLIAVLFIFSLFVSYSLLRPIREALGISGGTGELKWLFLGTFIATIVGSILAMILSGMIKRKLYTDFIFGFFALNLIGFFTLLHQIPQGSEAYLIVARSFYIWVSVFNIFVVSTAWSLLADVFSKERSARLFGIISAGASLGGIFGAFFVSVLSKFIDLPSFIFISIICLGISIVLKNLLIKEAFGLETLNLQSGFVSIKDRFDKPIGSKNPFVGSNLNAKTDDKSKENKMNTQVWYITAASGGLGLALAKYLLSKGDKIAGTSRNLKNIIDKLGKESENFLPLELKFGEKMSENIEANIAAIKSKFGRLDNVVNNAGYGLLGFVEETSEEDLRAQFEVNVFTPFLVAKHALKLMRPQAISEGGNAQNVRARIFNLSSIGGFRVTNNSTPYCMSKFALSAFSEGLLLDLKDFGIHSVNIMPAGFRTEFLGTSMQLSTDKIGDYDAKREAFEAHAKKL